MSGGTAGGVLAGPLRGRGPARTVDDMVDKQQVRADIKEFLTTRRARITPEQAGLRTYGGSRRVKGLRREEVATLSGISAEYYTRLERGNVAGASESVLEGIADALQLTDDERAHLLDLVRRPPAAARAGGAVHHRCESARPCNESSTR